VTVSTVVTVWPVFVIANPTIPVSIPEPMPAIDFTPTIASIPPSNTLLRLKEIPGALPNLHPLVN
jgi:hypothetical protein